MTTSGDPSFWDCSLRLYARPGVREACLALQDRCGADVNALLFALWAAECRQRLTPEDFALLERRTRAWQTGVVAPLRAVRRALKAAGGTGEVQGLRAKVAAAELEAERQQQVVMEALLPRRDVADPTFLAAQNLAGYARAAGVACPGLLEALLAAATRSGPASPE